MGAGNWLWGLGFSKTQRAQLAGAEETGGGAPRGGGLKGEKVPRVWGCWRRFRGGFTQGKFYPPKFHIGGRRFHRCVGSTRGGESIFRGGQGAKNRKRGEFSRGISCGPANNPPECVFWGGGKTPILWGVLFSATKRGVCATTTGGWVAPPGGNSG